MTTSGLSTSLARTGSRLTTRWPPRWWRRRSTNPPVCLATYGHPWVYCYPTTLITRAAPLLGLRVEVFPGVSPFDTLLVDLGMDIALDGIQMYEATDLLLRRRPHPERCGVRHLAADRRRRPDVPVRALHRRTVQTAAGLPVGLLPRRSRGRSSPARRIPLTRSVVQHLPLGELAAELARRAATSGRSTSRRSTERRSRTSS